MVDEYNRALMKSILLIFRTVIGYIIDFDTWEVECVLLMLCLGEVNWW